MKLVRSWPAAIPPGRAHVVDDIDRLIMSGYDYAVLADIGDDVLLIEWDLAVGEEELAAFADRAARAPDRVLAAPYRLYVGHSIQDPKTGTVWAAWRYRGDDQMSGGMVEAQPGDPTAHIVGFGLIYLPRRLILRYLAERKPEWGFSDISFCGWHYRVVTHNIDLDWATRPVHLHYTTPSVAQPDEENQSWPTRITTAPCPPQAVI